MNISNTDNRYPALKIVSGWLRITAWITVIFTGIATLMVLFQGGFGFVAAIGILVSGGFLAILQFAIAESVIVLVDIEFNTRMSTVNTMSNEDKTAYVKQANSSVNFSQTNIIESKSLFYVEKICRHGSILLDSKVDENIQWWKFRAVSGESVFEFNSIDELMNFANQLSNR